MKRNLVIIILIFSCWTLRAIPIDTINVFDITITGEYGCYSHDPYFINYHFEKGIFSITILDYNSNTIKKEIFNKSQFISFYDSLSLFKYIEFQDKYKSNIRSSATGFGSLKISSNNKIIKSINFQTLPDDSTNFQFLHEWLFKKARNISKKMDIQLLLSTEFYKNEYIPEYKVLQAIEQNLDYFKIDDIFTIIDTTQNRKIKNLMIESLVYFKDKRIVDKMGSMLLNNLNRKDSVNYSYPCFPCSMIELSPILAQDSSENKIQYLKKFLNSKSNIVKVESAMQLAKYGINDGKEIILKRINENLNSSSYELPTKEFYSLIFISDELIIKTLLNYYDHLKSSNYNKTSQKQWNIKHIIATTNLILDKNKNISYDLFYKEVGETNIKKGIELLDAKLKK